MTDLEKYQKVNACETAEELEECILSFAEDNTIQGRSRSFNAIIMATNLDKFMKDKQPPEVLTRMWGIRQQAMYIKHYESQ